MIKNLLAIAFVVVSQLGCAAFYSMEHPASYGQTSTGKP